MFIVKKTKSIINIPTVDMLMILIVSLLINLNLCYSLNFSVRKMERFHTSKCKREKVPNGPRSNNNGGETCTQLQRSSFLWYLAREIMK